MARSKQLRLSDIRAVFRLLSEAQELRADSAAWQRHMIESMCKTLGARHGSFLRWSGFSPNGKLKLLESAHGGSASREAVEHWVHLISSENWRGDLILDRAVEVPGQLRTRSRSSLIDDNTYYNSSAFNEIAKAAGVNDVIACWYRRNESEQVRALALRRAWGDGLFSVRHRNIVHLLNVELFKLYREGKLDQPSISMPVLSPRLGQLLSHLLKGMSVKESAAGIGISRRTTEDYVKELYRRFNVNSRAELLARFIHRP